MGQDRVKRVLIVEDDGPLRQSLAIAAEQRWGLQPLPAATFAAGRALVLAHQPAFAVIDLSIPGGGSGIELIRLARGENPNARIILISGCGSIRTAVRAMKAGADDVLCKPFKANELAAVLLPGKHAAPDSSEPATPMSADQVMWEHLHRVLDDFDGNISAASRILGVSRNTVKAWLDKPPPRR